MSTDASRTRRWGLVAGGTLLLGAIVAGVLWWTRPAEGEGLVVEVTVTNPDGKPVKNAQVARRFAPRWQSTDPQGRLRLAWFA